MRNVPDELRYLSPWSPGDGTVGGGYGTFRMWNFAGGGNVSLGAAFGSAQTHHTSS